MSLKGLCMFDLQLREGKPLQRVKVNGKRFYKLPDSSRALPSVTTVLSTIPKPYLEVWRKNIGEEEAARQTKTAGVHGTEMHRLAEDLILKGEYSTTNPFVRKRFKGIAEDIKENVTTVYGVEPMLYSKTLGVAGAIDLICKYKGKIAILDYKTSRKIKHKKDIEHYFLQAAMYAVFVYEHWGIVAETLVVMMSVEEDTAKPYVFEEPVGKWVAKAKQFVKDCELKAINLDDHEWNFEEE